MCSKTNNYLPNGHPALNYYSKNFHCYYSKLLIFPTTPNKTQKLG
jgi:hypothetical protein